MVTYTARRKFHDNDNNNGGSDESSSDEELNVGLLLHISDYRLKAAKHMKRFFFGVMIFSLLFVFYMPLLYSNTISTRSDSIEGWYRNTSRNTAIYILPEINTTLIQPANVCSDHLFLLIVICSSTTHFDNRQTIRETWANLTEFNYDFFAKLHKPFTGKYLKINLKKWKHFIIDTKNIPTNDNNSLDSVGTTNLYGMENERTVVNSNDINLPVKILFLIGQTLNTEIQQRINNESELYGDIIQESFIDTYNNLTLKSIMMLKWVNANCPNKIQFLMKCDDDTFVNIPNLLQILLGGTVPVYNDTIRQYNLSTVKTLSARNRLKTTRYLLMGTQFCNSYPIDNVYSKWYSPNYMYGEKKYPHYLSGVGYVMTMDVARKLYNASMYTPIFHLEDVYLTGICASAANIKPYNHHLFSHTSFNKKCELKGMITKHEITSSEMRNAYEFVTNTSIICPKPNKFNHLKKADYNNCN